MSDPKLHKDAGDGMSAGVIWYAFLLALLLCSAGVVILLAVRAWGMP
jgi:hypothetical protein